MARAPPLRMPFAPSTQRPIVAQSAIRNAGIAVCVMCHALIAAVQVTLRFVQIDRCAGFVACPITDSFPGGDKWVKKDGFWIGLGNTGWGVATWPICGGTGFWRDGSAWHGVSSCNSNHLVTAL